MFDKILYNKISYLLVIFLLFLLWWIITLNWFFPNKIIINDSYINILHILSWIVSIYILNQISKGGNMFYTKNKNVNILIKIWILIIIWILLFIKLNLLNFLIIFFIIASILLNIDSRISFLIALILLIYTVFYISIWNNKEIAEKLSIYAYYFLIIWVWLEIFSNSNLNIDMFKKNIKDWNL